MLNLMTTEAPTPTALSTITDATGSLAQQLPAVAAVGLGIGVVMFAIRRGWALVRSFAK